MESSGWKGRDGGTAFAREPRKVAWFYEWCDYWRAAGRLIVFALNIDDTSIAMDYFVRAGEGIFAFRTAYDETYSMYGPGTMLLEADMKLLLEQTDALWLDACTDPNNTFLLSMLPERRTTSTVFIGTGGAVDRALVSALPAMTRSVTELRSAGGWLRQPRLTGRSNS